MIILPSDHLIAHKNKFLKVLRKGVRLAREDYLVTLGVVPTRPETGYGYLKTAKRSLHGRPILRVTRFTEKPSLSKAKRFVKRQDYYWNGGMFIWKSSVILKAFKQYLPKVYKTLVGTGLKPVPTSQGHIQRVWRRLPNISLDYGILEKAKNVAAVAAKGIGWSDVGSWESLAEVLPKDAQGNFFKGDVIPINCRSTFVWGDKKVIAAVGLDNILIIDTPDALLVCRKDLSQAVKNVVAILQKNNRREVA